MSDPNPTEWIRRLGTGGQKASGYLVARRAIEARVGAASVDRYLEALFVHLRTSYFADLNARKFYTAATTPQWRDGAAAGLEGELRKIDSRLALQDEVLDKARRGQLAVTAIRSEPDTSYYVPTGGVPAAYREYDKAAQWIADGSPNKPRDRTRYYNVLVEAAAPAGLGAVSGEVVEGLELTATDFGSFDLVRTLHGSVFGFSLPSLRFGQPTSYPSTVGGEYLVRRLFRDTDIPGQSMRPRDYWTNWAMYFAGMIGAAQPFADGNKRAVHTYYALVVLHTTGVFIAPKVSFERALFDMS